MLVVRHRGEIAIVDLIAHQQQSNQQSARIQGLINTIAVFTLLIVSALVYSAYRYTLQQKNHTKQISQYQRELAQACTTAERAVREREIFLANINHDIRTPLNAILGFSELLEQKKFISNDNTYLNNIRLSGNKLLTLIDELLDLSTIGSGQLVLNPKPIVLADMLQTVTADLEVKVRSKNVQYDIQVDPAVPTTVLADSQRLIQILLAVGNHALKLTEAGYVRLSVQRIGSDQPTHAELLFTIEDSGSGIAEDKLNYVFDLFGQVSDNVMLRSGGTGLGLNIARSLVNLMNGTIDVKSNVGQGTTFTVQLPFELPVAAPPQPTESLILVPPRLLPTEMGVLIVEDNIMNQKVMEGYLKRYHLKPTIANNGLEAVEILKRESFDLIFMDIQMPEMDGYSATMAIRQQMALNTPIVAMTAYTMTGERERCLAAGMNEYLSKPICVSQLDDTLSRFAPVTMKTQKYPIANASASLGSNIVQESYLDELMDGDTDLLTEMVVLFELDLPSYRQTLFEAIKQNDQPLFNRTSHKFRSSLNSLAMLDTAKKMKQLEVDNTLDRFTKASHLTNLFTEINQGLAFLNNKTQRTELKIVY